MEFVLDGVDKKIISIFKNNSRESFTKIATELNLSEGAIRKRVKSLIKNKIIEKFTIQTKKILYPVRAIVMIKLNVRAPSDKILEFIRKMSGVNCAYPVTGGHDIFVDIETADTKELYEKIDSIRNQNGVSSTLTMTVLS